MCELSARSQSIPYEDTSVVKAKKIKTNASLHADFTVSAALWSFRAAVPKEVSLHWSEELGWLADQLGNARDLDVFIAEGLTSAKDKLPLPGGDKLAAIAEKHRAAAYDVFRSTLGSDRYAQFKRDFREWFTAPGWEQASLTNRQH